VISIADEVLTLKTGQKPKSGNMSALVCGFQCNFSFSVGNPEETGIIVIRIGQSTRFDEFFWNLFLPLTCKYLVVFVARTRAILRGTL